MSASGRPARSPARLRLYVAAATLLVAVGLAGAAINWRTGDTAESRAYIHQPLYGVWGGLILLQLVGLAALGLGGLVVWHELRTIEPPPPRQDARSAVVQWFAVSVLVGAALLAPALAMPTHYPRSYPDHFTLRVWVMGAFGAAAMGVAAAALFRIRAVVGSLPASDAAAAERFRYLWGRQRLLLGSLGAVLAINVLGTAAKFQMNNAFVVPAGSTEPNLPDVPSTYVLVVGALYGAVILAVYLPVYLTSRQAGEELATRFATPQAAATGADWLAANAERETYRSALGVAEGVREHLERTTGILAPLIAALFAALLPQITL